MVRDDVCGAVVISVLAVDACAVVVWITLAVVSTGAFEDVVVMVADVGIADVCVVTSCVVVFIEITSLVSLAFVS